MTDGEITKMVAQKAKEAKEASWEMARAKKDAKNMALMSMAASLKAHEGEILAANAKDVEAAKEAGLSKAMLDRLTLDAKRLADTAQGLRDVAKLADPVGSVIDTRTRPNGLRIDRIRSPLGVVGIVYESRPNVTVDAASLCLKAGNAVILRGGSEALLSNLALAKVIQEGLADADLPTAAVQIMERKEREIVLEMLHRKDEIDVIIPRGGKELIDFVLRESYIPVIRHDIGNCHVYVDHDVDLKMAEDIVYNAKVQRPGVCNAMEHLLVHQRVAEKFVPAVAKRLQAAGVEIRGDENVLKLVPDAKAATPEDWTAEYLDLICGIKVVKDLEDAIRHINIFGSHHSDAIVTNNKADADRFTREVDSAVVLVNASTRFTDGAQFGLGAEIGISTQKLHARGPMALEELTCAKWVVYGTGQIRS